MKSLISGMLQEPWLTRADIDRLSEAMSSARTALLHILTSRVRYRWGMELGDSERVVTRPNAIESTTGAAIMAGTFQCIPGLQFFDIV